MSADYFEDAYVPDLIPESDLAHYERAGMGRRVGWGERPAVVIVDVTNQFSDDDWPLGRSDTGDAAVAANERLVGVARQHDVPIVYVRGLGTGDRFDDPTATSFSKSAGRFDPDEGNTIRPEIAPQRDDVVLQKPRRSAFFGTRLQSLLREYAIDTLVVTGLVTSGCVRATVVDGFERDYRVVVPRECVADRGQVPHEVSLFDMDMKFADVTPLDEVVDAIRSE